MNKNTKVRIWHSISAFIPARSSKVNRLDVEVANNRNNIDTIQKEFNKNEYKILFLQDALEETKKDLVMLEAKQNEGFTKKIDIQQQQIQKILEEEEWKIRREISEQLKKSTDIIKVQQQQIDELKKKLGNIKAMCEEKATIKSLDDYKKAANNALSQQKREMNYLYYKGLHPDQYAESLKEWFHRSTGEILHLENPQTFNEKIQWLKLYDSTPLKTRLADKYLVRDWVKEKIGEKYLIPLLGVWNKFDDIDFDMLPNQFVLKCNHGCGYNIIVKDKSTLNIADARNKINTWMNENWAFRCGLELHYSPIPRKIIAEEYIENIDGDAYDYKIFCFNGKAKYILLMMNRSTNMQILYLDTNWNRQTFTHGVNLYTGEIKKPERLNEMLELAEKMAEGFSLVRVDFYILNDGNIRFGEMTFTPASGLGHWNPPDYNFRLGQMINLSLPIISGLNESEQRNEKIIVSLTSHPKRIDTVHLAIATLMNQTCKPDCIILYLGEEEFPGKEQDLPEELLNLRTRGLSIKWYRNIYSYKKLIPALKEFPEDIIITVDDDIYYPPRLIELLYQSYLKDKKSIHCHRLTRIYFDGKDVRIFPRDKMNYRNYQMPSFLNKFTGCQGVLYPPHCFPKEVFNEKAWKKLAPTSDDIWFWLMAVLNGVRVRAVENNIPKLNYISGTQETGLYKINDASGDKSLFYKHLENILESYPQLNEILRKEKDSINPKVSIVIPVYNVELYLRQCLDSVINQTLREIEIICVDDGSTDNSLQILKEYSKNDQRFIILQQANSGVGNARNNALKIIKGEYIYFLDSDDWLEQNALEILVNEAEKTAAEVVLCQFKKFDNFTNEFSYGYLRTDLIKKTPFSAKDLPDSIFSLTSPAPWTKLYLTSFIKNSGVKFTTLKSSNDITFSLFLLAAANRISYVKDSLINYRINRKDSISTNRGKNQTDVICAYNILRYILKQNNLYDTVEQSFLSQELSSYCFELKKNPNILFLQATKSYLSEESYYELEKIASNLGLKKEQS